MDSSKVLVGGEECSSSESGWTRYIASPDKEYSQADDEDGEDGSIGQHGYKKDADEDDDSDDSMASDASSGPSDQGHLCGRLGGSRGLGHAGKRDERKQIAKKQSQQEDKKKHEQIKAGKDKSGNRANSAGTLKKI